MEFSQVNLWHVSPRPNGSTWDLQYFKDAWYLFYSVYVLANITMKKIAFIFENDATDLKNSYLGCLSNGFRI